jgi:hypothetical protein
VDDLIIIGSDQDGIKSLKAHLKREFDIKDLGNLTYFLGIEITRSNKGLFLSQTKYMLDLLKETDKLGVKSANIPMEYTSKSITDTKPYNNVERF